MEALLAEIGAKYRVEDLLRMDDGSTLTSVPYTDALLEGVDCVVILTNHSQYNWEHVVQHSRLIVDTRNVTSIVVGQARIVGL